MSQFKLPRRFAGNSKFEKDVNAIRSAVERSLPAMGARGMSSPSGSVSAPANTNTQGMVMWVPVCKRDGSEWYIPFRVAGEAVEAADLPTGAYIFDPPE